MPLGEGPYGRGPGRPGGHRVAVAVMRGFGGGFRAAARWRAGCSRPTTAPR
jgi:hypothetical protein